VRFRLFRRFLLMPAVLVLSALSLTACDRPSGPDNPQVSDAPEDGYAAEVADVDDVPETAPAPRVAVRPGRPAVVINGVALSDREVTALTAHYDVRPRPGRYWYDRVCGAWGYEGGPTVAFALAGVAVGGPLRQHASNGNTGVIVNGRELPDQDVRALQQICQVRRGRWWVDAQGNCGPEGGFAVINLRQAAAQASGNRSGSAYGAGGFLATDEYGQHMFMGSNGESWWSGK
jgi:hypothetical protein